MAEKYSGIKAGNPLKASDMESALDTKANVSDMTTALAAKQNKIAAGTTDNIVAYSGTAGTLNTLDRVTGVRAAASALDTAIPTEKAVASGLAAKINTADAQSKIAAGTANNIVAYSGAAGTLNTLDRVTAVRAAAAALDTAIPTEKAVATALDAKANSSDMTTALATKANAADVQTKLPVGTILMFDGTGWQDNVTLVGWYQCNKANKDAGRTPDLSDKFIMGSSATNQPKERENNFFKLTSSNIPQLETSTTANLTGKFLIPARRSYHDNKALINNGIISVADDTDAVYYGESTTINSFMAKVDANHKHTAGTAENSLTAVDNRPSYYAVIFIKRVA
ncbi:MAG: hypothetical protein LBQ83_01120 [Candidatus Margulisbacteria bacterium]|jgi:hypothetical protein|nr:hypothetical protein [Candidatus Margulisiibacteriota bacterium]